jgi:hypothetical protein
LEVGNVLCRLDAVEATPLSAAPAIDDDDDALSPIVDEKLEFMALDLRPIVTSLAV